MAPQRPAQRRKLKPAPRSMEVSYLLPPIHALSIADIAPRSGRCVPEVARIIKHLSAQGEEQRRARGGSVGNGSWGRGPLANGGGYNGRGLVARASGRAHQAVFPERESERSRDCSRRRCCLVRWSQAKLQLKRFVTAEQKTKKVFPPGELARSASAGEIGLTPFLYGETG